MHCCVLTVTWKHSALLLNSNTTGCFRYKKKYLKAFQVHTLQLCTLWWCTRCMSYFFTPYVTPTRSYCYDSHQGGHSATP
jgi:hypothetical protein